MMINVDMYFQQKVHCAGDFPKGHHGYELPRSWRSWSQAVPCDFKLAVQIPRVLERWWRPENRQKPSGRPSENGTIGFGLLTDAPRRDLNSVVQVTQCGNLKLVSVLRGIYQFNALPRRFDNRDLGRKTSVAVARFADPGFWSPFDSHFEDFWGLPWSRFFSKHGRLDWTLTTGDRMRWGFCSMGWSVISDYIRFDDGKMGWYASRCQVVVWQCLV